mgnify:CR=1 FL=1
MMLLRYLMAVMLLSITPGCLKSLPLSDTLIMGVNTASTCVSGALHEAGNMVENTSQDMVDMLERVSAVLDFTKTAMMGLFTVMGD